MGDRRMVADRRIVAAMAGVFELSIALDELLKLSNHYAELLNMQDGGRRMTFENADAWMARLREVAA
jgi:hypothetical protein